MAYEKKQIHNNIIEIDQEKEKIELSLDEIIKTITPLETDRQNSIIESSKEENIPIMEPRSQEEEIKQCQESFKKIISVINEQFKMQWQELLNGNLSAVNRIYKLGQQYAAFLLCQKGCDIVWTTEKDLNNNQFPDAHKNQYIITESRLLFLPYPDKKLKILTFKDNNKLEGLRNNIANKKNHPATNEDLQLISNYTGHSRQKDIAENETQSAIALLLYHLAPSETEIDTFIFLHAMSKVVDRDIKPSDKEIILQTPKLRNFTSPFLGRDTKGEDALTLHSNMINSIDDIANLFPIIKLLAQKKQQFDLMNGQNIKILDQFIDDNGCRLIKMSENDSFEEIKKSNKNHYIVKDQKLLFWSPGVEEPQKIELLSGKKWEDFIEELQLDIVRDADPRDLRIITSYTGSTQNSSPYNNIINEFQYEERLKQKKQQIKLPKNLDNFDPSQFIKANKISGTIMSCFLNFMSHPATKVILLILLIAALAVLTYGVAAIGVAAAAGAAIGTAAIASTAAGGGAAVLSGVGAGISFFASKKKEDSVPLQEEEIKYDQK